MTGPICRHENAEDENGRHEMRVMKNAGHDNAGHEITWSENAGHENVGHENAGPILYIGIVVVSGPIMLIVDLFSQ